LITNRQSIAGAGTQNAGLAGGGYVYQTGKSVSCTEEYDGTSWSAGGTLITERKNLTGAGTQNEGLAVGGNIRSGFSIVNVTCTEEYNGTSWSAGGALIVGRDQLAGAGAGTQSAGLVAGGSGPVSCTEEYNIPLQIIDCVL
jgi:hypothetical protein